MGTYGGIDGLKDVEEAMETLKDEMELGNHVGIVIGRRGATIIAMQWAMGVCEEFIYGSTKDYQARNCYLWQNILDGKR